MPVALLLLATSCGNRQGKREAPTRGQATILVDNTVAPLFKGQAEVFESQYRSATLDILALPETEISNLLLQDSGRLAVMLRTITPTEREWFESRRITPRISEVGFDAIALITGKESRDTTVSTALLKNMLRGEDRSRILVFDNPASGIVRYMQELIGDASMEGVYALQSDLEVIEYVNTHPEAIGFIGVNWLYELDPQGRQYSTLVNILAVGDDETGYFMPTQGNITDRTYPFIRTMYFINAQGSAGLGLGFASFLVGDVGQRIILREGLVPVTFPKRQVVVRKQL